MMTKTRLPMKTRAPIRVLGRAGHADGGRRGEPQRGIALLVALVVLIVVTLLGTAAMRSALFQSRISVNAQASQLLFQGAESGLESITSHAANPVPNNLFRQVVNAPGTVVRFCLSNAAPGFFTDAGAAVTARTDTDLTINVNECPGVGGAVAVAAILTAPPPAAMGGLPQPPQGYSLDNYSQSVVYARAYANIAGFGGTKSHVQTWSLLTPLD